MTTADAIALYRETKANRRPAPTDVKPMTKKQFAVAREMLDGWVDHRRGRNGNDMSQRKKQPTHRAPPE